MTAEITDALVDESNGPEVVVDLTDAAQEPNSPAALGRWARMRRGLRQFRKEHPLGLVAGLVILLFIVTAILAPIVATHDPSATGRQPGQKLASPSFSNFFGTDQLGRDIFSRVVYGSRISLIVATFTVLVSTVLGTLVGAVSGYLGGKVDMILQRIVDAVMSIPVLILALFIVSLLGSSVTNVVLALSIIYIPRFARIARGEMLRIRNAEYVTASRALGAGSWRIIRGHGIPNLVAPIIILASLTYGQAMIAEAALSFLGVGAPITEPSWGQMLSSSREFMTVAWWAVVFPGVALSAGVLAFNLFGDALRDYLDPKLVQ